MKVAPLRRSALPRARLGAGPSRAAASGSTPSGAGLREAGLEARLRVARAARRPPATELLRVHTADARRARGRHRAAAPCASIPTRRPGPRSYEAALLRRGRGRRRGGPRARRRARPRVLRSCARPATTRRPTGPWASASSTTWRWPRRTRSRAGLERVLVDRLRRAPRQRHPGHLLRRPARALRLVARLSRSTRARARSTEVGEGDGPRLHGEPAACPRGWATPSTRASTARSWCRSAAPSIPSSCSSRPASTPTAAIRWRACASPTRGYRELRRRLPRAAAGAARGRAVFALEGGYDLDGLAARRPR